MESATTSYPESPAGRDDWIRSRRPERQAVDPQRPYAYLVERERTEGGELANVATIFLTNRECPWRCLMCDLWRNTLTESVPPGAIPAQIDYALAELAVRRRPPGAGPEPIQRLKLYNSGSFFDPRAIPIADYPAIAGRARPFDQVIVECHPALVGDAALRFRDLLDGFTRESQSSPQTHPPSDAALRRKSGARLEVAIGLETVEPRVLDRLNKRMTLADFARAARFLDEHGIALRAFVLVKPPFLDEAAGLEWAKRSIDFAFNEGAAVVSLIPTRSGNGALDALAATGDFAPPRLATLEAALGYGVAQNRGRVFADEWDLEKFSTCALCFPARQDRLRRINQRQELPPPVGCPICGGG